MHIKTVFLCTVLAVLTQQLDAFDAETLKGLSQDELIDFLEYYVKLGYRVVHGDASNSLRIRNAVSSNAYAVGVYKWAVKNRSVAPGLEERGVVCFPNKQCVNLGDLGVHP